VSQDDADRIGEELLAQALEAADHKEHHIEQEIARLTGKLSSVRRERQLLRELLAVRRGETLTGDHAGGPSVAKSEEAPNPPARVHPVVDAAVSELEKAGRPLHISELMQLLAASEVNIPGSGQAANLISHLTRDSRVQRPSRGMYALTEWDREESPKVKPSVRRRVRGTSKAQARRIERS